MRAPAQSPLAPGKVAHGAAPLTMPRLVRGDKCIQSHTNGPAGERSVLLPFSWKAIYGMLSLQSQGQARGSRPRALSCQGALCPPAGEAHTRPRNPTCAAPGLATRLAHLLHELRKTIRAASAEDDTRALAGQHPRGGGAKAAAGSGQKNNFVLYARHALLPCLSLCVQL